MTLSINNNASSFVALETLNATQAQLSATNNAVSTGKKIANASDGSAAFGIAQQMDGAVAGQSAVNDGLSFAGQVLGSANTAANSILDILKDVRKQVTSIGGYEGNDVALSGVSSRILSDLKNVASLARNSTYNGVNLLAASKDDGIAITSASYTFVTSLGGETQAVTNFSSLVGSYTGHSSGGILTDMLGLTSDSKAGTDPTANVFLTADGSLGPAATTDGKLDVKAMVSLVDKAISAMTVVTGQIGSATTMINNMSSYGQTISDNLNNGISALTDADMSAESAKLTALQTKQSLAIKALSIANGQSQNILQLFQG